MRNLANEFGQFRAFAKALSFPSDPARPRPEASEVPAGRDVRDPEERRGEARLPVRALGYRRLDMVNVDL